jgi:hypothetical protein
MLWTIAVILIIFWMLGLDTDLTMGSFIHVLYAAAVALLVVSLSQEVTNNRMLRHVSRKVLSEKSEIKCGLYENSRLRRGEIK